MKKIAFLSLCLGGNPLLSVLICLSFVNPGFLQPCASAADLIVAMPLLVDLNAEDVAFCHKVATWPNRGTLGDFNAVGYPIAVDVNGVPSVMFDGLSYFDGPLSVPAIEGANPRSIEVMAYNPTLSESETLICWSHRDCPGGSFMAMSYGNSPVWGAGTHWSGNNIEGGLAWAGDYTPAPKPHTWWYLVYTYDGKRASVYVNGVLSNSRAIKLNTLPGNIIRIAAQTALSGSVGLSTFMYSGFIAEIRVHGGALSQADIQHNFMVRNQKYFGDLALVGSWKFDEGAGVIAADSTGTSQGIVNGATWTSGIMGGALRFDGIKDFVDCGNTPILGNDKLTINAWVDVPEFTPHASVAAKGGALFEADFDLALAADRVSFECGNDDPCALGFVRVTSKSAISPNKWHMVSGVRNGSEISVFIDGVKRNSESYSFPTAIRDLPVVIGASPFKGTIDNVQIYSGALSEETLLGLFKSTPNPSSGGGPTR
jgi:hypothetical protein